MGTKNKPGNFDCYASAEPDEPMFTLLARDRLAGHLVSLWSKMRYGDHEAASVVFHDMMAKHLGHYQVEPDAPKAEEAMECTTLYGTQRKTGVGFNAPLVLGGRMRHDWRKRYDLMRRLTRLSNERGRSWKPAGASVVETLAKYSK